MPPSPVRTVSLTCHGDTPNPGVRSVAARVERAANVLAVSYEVEGDLNRLRIPAPQPPRITGRLWQHSCCEIFIARTGLPAYHEFNFAPSGEWAAYSFWRYRDGSLLADESLRPPTTVRMTAQRLELDALVRLDLLSPKHVDAALSLALSVVIEDQDGLLSYWALRHGAGKPDFHHPDAFALELDEVRH